MMPILSIILASLETEEDRQNFMVLHNQYRSLMFDRAYEILQNEHDAEDAVSEAFLRLASNFEKINSFECHKKKGYVVKVTENVCKTMYTRRKREKKRLISFEDVAYEMADDSVLEDQVMASIDAEVARRLIDQLPETDRDILSLRVALGLNDQEIAESLRISNAAARKRLQRAKQKVIQLWKEADAHAIK